MTNGSKPPTKPTPTSTGGGSGQGQGPKQSGPK